MESLMQQQYDAFDAKIQDLAPFMDEFDALIKKHNVCKADVELVMRYMVVE